MLPAHVEEYAPAKKPKQTEKAIRTPGMRFETRPQSKNAQMLEPAAEMRVVDDADRPNLSLSNPNARLDMIPGALNNVIINALDSVDSPKMSLAYDER